MRERRLNILALVVCAYVVVFISAKFDFFRIYLRAQVDFLPGLVVVAAMLFGVPSALAVSLVGGLLNDSLSANPLGASTFSLAVVAAVVHYNKDLLLRDQMYPQFILGAGASAAAPLLSYLVVAGRGGQPMVGWASLWIWVVMAAVGGLMTPVWFKAFRLWEKLFHYPEAPESSFRADREIKRGRD
jgi:hypothetical protein